MSKVVNQWAAVAFSYALMTLAIKRGKEDPISGVMCTSLLGSVDSMLSQEDFTDVAKTIVKKIKTGDIKDDLLERMLKDATFDKDGIPQTIGEDVASFLEEAQTSLILAQSTTISK